MCVCVCVCVCGVSGHLGPPLDPAQLLRNRLNPVWVSVEMHMILICRQLGIFPLK